MELYIYKRKTFSMIFKLILLCIILYQTNQLNQIDIQFPKSLTLLDNSLLIVCNSGIHFYNSDLSEENIELGIPLIF